MNSGSITPPAPGSSNRPRPSLIASNADARPRNESRNATGILTSVEAAAGIHPARTSTPKRLVLPLVLLVVGGVLAYALMASKEQGGSNAATPPLAATLPAAQPAVGTQIPAPKLVAEAPTQSAVIETIVPEPQDAKAKGKPADAEPAKNPLSSLMASKPASMSATMASKPTPARTVTVHSKPASDKAVTADKPLAVNQPASVVPPATIKARQDSDVDLITALVAHAEGRPIAIKEKKLPASAAVTSSQ